MVKDIYSDYAESQMIGAMLYDPGLLTKISVLITPDYFFISKYNEIYKVMLDRLKKGFDTSAPAIIGEHPELLRDITDIMTRGQQTSTLAENSILPELVHYYKLREARTAADRFNKQAGQNVNNAAEQLISDMDAVIQINPVEDTDGRISVISREAQLHIAKLAKLRREDSGKLIGYSTGIDRLDEITGGYIPGTIHIIGGYSNIGKTTLVLTSAGSLIENRRGLAYFSTDEKARVIYLKLISAMTGIHFRKLISNYQLDSYEQKKKEHAETLLNQNYVRIPEHIKTPEMLLHKCKKFKREMPLEIVVIDFIQNLASDRRDVYDGMREVVNMMLRVMDMDICVIGLSQIDQETQRHGHHGKLMPFKGSGDIGNNADIAVLLRENAEKQAAALKNNDMERQNKYIDCLIKKNRITGYKGMIDLYMNKTFTGVLDYDDFELDMPQKELSL